MTSRWDGVVWHRDYKDKAKYWSWEGRDTDILRAVAWLLGQVSWNDMPEEMKDILFRIKANQKEGEWKHSLLDQPKPTKGNED